MLTTLKFMADLPRYESEKPYEMFGLTEIPAQQRSNCEYVAIDDIPLLDVRDYLEETFSLKEQGFEFLRHKSQCPLSASDFELPGNEMSPNVETYLKETIAIVKERLGALEVVCFDWRVRRVN
jgi:hypothetical protein